ncbi:MAG: Ribosome maturation factor RimM [bacterium ADurb.Bin431]|nr:MAG: Ribosome maturation factor RimM [bacterium ADurb.Bin431]HNY91639.1 ribosome maturation factor RimM [bacterium]HOH06101.1 ribosome maturation factor RimM [bacterium]
MADQSGKRARTPDFVVIGQVRRPHGIRGALRVAPLTDDPERYHLLKRVWLNHGDDERTPFTLAQVQLIPDGIILSLDGISDRNAAETWRQAWVEIPGEEVLPLAEGRHYIFEIIGVQVVTEEGVALGEVVDILRNPAHDVYVVRGDEREYLIPAVPEFIRQIDSETGLMIVHVVDGLLDL